MLVRIVTHNEHTGKTVLRTHNEEFLIVTLKYLYGIEEGQILRYNDFEALGSCDVYNINTGEKVQLKIICKCKTKEEANAYLLTENKYYN